MKNTEVHELTKACEAHYSRTFQLTNPMEQSTY
jgi:hypothetical protein